MMKRMIAKNSGKTLWKTRGAQAKALKKSVGLLVRPQLPIEVRRRRSGNRFPKLPFGLIGMFALGAGVALLFDPRAGRRRRALLRDQAIHWSRVIGDGFAKRARDLGNRASGLTSELQARSGDEMVSDPVLEERVRSQIGRAISHPGAIQVTAAGGRVTLSGPVLRNEVDQLLKEVSGVRGVAEVVNRLDIHEQPGDIPSLQTGQSDSGRGYPVNS